MTDEAIIKLYFERDEEALKITEKQYGSYCFTIAHTMLASKEDAEEIVNDTLVRAWNAIPPEKPKSLTAFLGKITRNLALHRLEKKGRNKRRHASELALDELDEILPGGDSATFDHFILRDTLNAFLDSLSIPDRMLFLKRYWYMKPIEALSREMNMTKSNVKIRLFRLRDALRLRLIEEGIIPTGE